MIINYAEHFTVSSYDFRQIRDDWRQVPEYIFYSKDNSKTNHVHTPVKDNIFASIRHLVKIRKIRKFMSL